ncbi:Pentatricopeptide repeat [Melia azedarach]|uniref:Pentatricopeptide repeat n=1 Tax=Melia azedarach TaxID=155640 RepID=A0ACC1YMN4_MELAZ|nr:Pentatricopeptide repeat [Melia azedarach]
MFINGLKFPNSMLTFKQLNQIHAQIIKNPQPHILNQLLKLLTNSCTPQNAFLLYNQMLHYPFSYNHYTFTQALKACALALAHKKGLEIHAHVMKCGHLRDIFIQNSLLHFYISVKDILSAHQIFCSVVVPDVVSWTTIISGLSRCGFYREAVDMFCGISVQPNANTLVSVVSACCGLRSLKLGKSVHAYSLRNLDECNIVLDNAILDMYIRCGSLVGCSYLFVKMPKRDVVSWTTIIGGYVQWGLCEEAIRVFQEMVKTKEAEPNEATLVNVLSACSSISALSFGQYVHNYINNRRDLLANNLVMNAVINMYVKCGDVGMAIQVFNMLAYKDAICWSTIISGLAMNGYAKQALQLFSLMIMNEVSPDDITFIGLLSACSHGGLVDQGLMLFKAMSSVYEIVPQMQHYACMVDMYGRAGLLDEAEALIRKMPTEAEWSVWGALLNACRIHGNELMFDRIRQELANMRGVSPGTFALLSNTYAGSDRWEDANKIRDEIRSMALKKQAGCSWIEVNSSIPKEKNSEKCEI